MQARWGKSCCKLTHSHTPGVKSTEYSELVLPVVQSGVRTCPVGPQLTAV